VIRQAICCDMCESEKKQTNHWFVAQDHNGELRIAGWNSRNRLRPNSKHLCGQVCLHKLLDDFINRTIEVKGQTGTADRLTDHHPLADTVGSLTSDAAYEETVGSSPRRIDAPEPAVQKAIPSRPHPPKPAAPAALPLRMPAELVAMPGRQPLEEQPPVDEGPRYASRNWRAEAWDRERERELRAVERRPEVSTRRRSGS
jgi:hypothetical protein